ncbi:MAG TPA: dihydrodipicolinate synthase family protein [Woeseiaceae bacterium]|nr:dihydrodipicolinate synthase family protein [Woeseiaceae bacterium]
MRFHGVLAPVVTPFRDDLAADALRLIRQCRWLLSEGAGLAVFGTNSEGNSLSVGEKIELLDRLVDAGIDPARMMPGTGCCALTDTVRLTRHAVSLGCGGVLMLPPFYYKAVDDEGLFRSYAEVVERVGSDALRVYLYHIPPISGVGLSVDLVGRLVQAYPECIAGIKDSSGDWNNTRALLDCDWEDFRVFAGSEAFLLRTLRAGGAGVISATANVHASAIYRLYREWQSPKAESLQQDLNRLREVLQRYPMIAALKAVIAGFGSDPEWERLRPPLLPLSKEQKATLLAELHGLKFKL